MCVSTGLCAGRQYHLISEEKNFAEAQSYCREKYTDLATIDSMEDVETLNRTAETAGVSSIAWIGLYKTWGWSLSDTSFYKHGEEEFRGWEPGQPDNYGDCTEIYPDGGWHDYRCTYKEQAVCCDSLSQSTGLQEKELICTQLHGDFSFMLTFIKKHQTAEKNIQTQKNSNIKFASMLCVMLPLHSSSLDLFSELDVTFVLTDDSMTWTEAQSYCREHHTDLASVRNQAENQKVQELVQAAGVDFVWIGLFRDSWKWSDGSNSSFRRWLPGQPDNKKGMEACAAADFRSSGRWVDLNCNSRRAFICYGPAPKTSSKQVFRLRLRSSVDPNDPAVMEAMLKQFKQKLKAQGVNDDVTLSFRKQPV
ncbi:macrophage mannose receptor 1-like [Centropristis striata]|uniref:macrophage mannose receptor 1-like n=1 Tax=Centropristis striata TaxID=184440 RepID=UPI0027E09DF8|nr:macrophage mannose receptor 1-like [Centropristis striata]